MDWNALLQVGRAGRRQPRDQCDKYQPGHAGPVQRADPHVWTGAWAPKAPTGPSRQPAMDKLIEGILAEFDTAKRLALLTQLHEMMSEEAVLIFVAHDLNPARDSPR